jgi:hypothetical protein
LHRRFNDKGGGVKLVLFIGGITSVIEERNNIRKRQRYIAILEMFMHFNIDDFFNFGEI